MNAGCNSGIRAGIANINAGAGNWSIDATSGRSAPVSSTEWSTFRAGSGLSISSPSSLWLFQEASGNLSDSIGAATLTKSGAGAATYQTAVTGWSRKAVSYADGASVTFSNTAQAPNSATTSSLVLLYTYVTATPASGRVLIQQGTPAGNAQKMQTGTLGHYTAVSSNSVSSAASPFDGTVRPVLLLNDVTNSRCVGYTDADKMVTTYRAALGSLVGLAGNATCPPGGILYACMWTGAAAEMSDGQIRSLLQALGWSISWS